MENEGHYIAVGSFTLLTITLLLSFVIVIASHKNVTETRRYEIHFNGSVAGLNEGGEVRYLGVKVGTISQILLVAGEPNQVRVLIDIKDTVPIYRDTVAKLKLQGITGISFIELSQQGEDHTPLSLVHKEHGYPVIKAKDSDLAQIVEAMPTVMDQIAELATRANKLLNDENIATFSQIMNNTKMATQELEQSLKQFTRTMRELETGTSELRPDMKKTLAATRQAMQDLAVITKTTRQLYQHNRVQLDAGLSQGLPELQTLLQQSRAMIVEMRKLVQKLERDPSQLIYRSQPQGMELAP